MPDLIGVQSRYGVTCRWAKVLSESGDYQAMFEESGRKQTLRWVQAHASHDGKQFIEALEIIYEFLGNNPDQQTVNRVKHAIKKSYDLYAAALDEVMGHA